MKQIIVSLFILAGVSCQIHTKLHEDGYHYDPPEQDLRMTFPSPPTPEIVVTLPPLPSFIPSFNFPQIIPVLPVVQQPTAAAAKEYLPPLKTDYLPPVEEDLTNWEQWKKKFNKRYTDLQEDDYRHEIFDDNVKFILSQQAEFEAGTLSYEVSINKFADLKRDEFVQRRTGLKKPKSKAKKGYDYTPPGGDSRTLEAGFGAGFGGAQSGGFGSFGGAQSGGFGGDFGAGFGGDQSGGFGDFDVRTNDGSGFGGKSQSKNTQGGPGLDGASEDDSNFDDLDSESADEKEEVDWRKEGAITPVKDQGNCASCWAFTASGALEAHNFLKKKTGPTPLSEQNLIDCVKENDGCDGGFMTEAYIYAAQNPGVDTESSYPYEAKQSQCRFTRASVGGECVSHKEIPIGNEKALERAVANAGPVSVGIDGGQRGFQFYKSGLYFDTKCETEVNHAVLIVGYGKTETGEEYWICKNSWDTDWGEAGYIRMAKNKNNHCGITSLASYPIV